MQTFEGKWGVLCRRRVCDMMIPSEQGGTFHGDIGTETGRTAHRTGTEPPGAGGGPGLPQDGD